MGLRHNTGRCGLLGFLRPRLATLAVASSALVLAAGEPGCTSGGTGPQSPCPPGETCEVRLTLLHTSDIHSRIFPYDLQILQIDSELGLGTLNEVKNVGGVARLSYVLNRERARADRVLHVDSGDIFEGAPVFNYFQGEPETRASSMMGTDVMVIGNHEFDDGPINAVRQLHKWADFPLLAANYTFPATGTAHDTGIGSILHPFTVFNLEGLKVGVIGMANFSSLGSVFQQPNSLGIDIINTTEVAQAYVDLLRPLVDVVVVLSHLGLDVDEHMVRGTTGIDVVEGGHNHIVINPPQVQQDCSADPNNPGYIWAVNPNIPFDPANPVYDPADVLQQHPNEFRRFCTPRKVLISHSGAFAKYLGRLDLMFSNDPTLASPTGNPADYDPTNGFEVVSSQYIPFPIDDSVPEDPNIVNMLLPYERHLDQTVDLELLAGYAPSLVTRTAPQGGDSPLGNLISDSMWLRLGVQTDFAMTNSTGIRTDMIQGPVTIEEMFNIFPFNNTITKMQLSGTEVREMFDFIAGRSQGRGCVSQAQIAGARVVLNCGGCNRPNVSGTGGGNGTPCTRDEQCIGGTPGSCVAPTGSPCPTGEQDCACQITACAEQIYIGHLTDCPNDPGCACQVDSDCPGSVDQNGNKTVLQGQCDTAGGVQQTGTCAAPLQLENVYDFATSNYLAAGGSGFRVLQRNTTQVNTQIEQRDAVIDFVRNGHPCGYTANANTPEGLPACSADSDCPANFVCACQGQVTATGTVTAQTCVSSGSCDPSVGRCVRQDCRDSVATFHEKMCQGSPDINACNTDLDACSLAGEECKILPCVDANVGALSDGRVEMIGR
jgi:5'-nucleotidase